MPPGTVTGHGVVDGQQPAAGLRLGHPRSRRPPEVDPPDVAEGVGVAVGGRHLLARQQLDAVAATRVRQVGVVARGVVVGDPEEVESRAGSQGGELVDGQRPVRVHRVGMAVTCQPLEPVHRGQVPPRGPALGGDLLRLLRQHVGGLDLDPPVDALVGQAVQPENHLPLAGRQAAVEVAGCAPASADLDHAARPARPAAPALRVDEPEVEHPGRPVRPVVVERDPQAGAAVGHIEGDVVPDGFGSVLRQPPTGEAGHRVISSPSPSPR